MPMPSQVARRARLEGLQTESRNWRIRMSRPGRWARNSNSPPRALSRRCSVPTYISPCDSMRDRVGCRMPRVAATSSCVNPTASRICESSISAMTCFARASLRRRFRPHSVFEFPEVSSHQIFGRLVPRRRRRGFLRLSHFSSASLTGRVIDSPSFVSSLSRRLHDLRRVLG